MAAPARARSPRWWVKSQNRGRQYRKAVDHALKLIDMSTKAKSTTKPAPDKPATSPARSEAAKHKQRQARNKRRIEQLETYTATGEALIKAQKVRQALKKTPGSMYVRGNLDWLKDQLAGLAAEAREAGHISESLKAYNALAILEGHVPGEGGIDTRTRGEGVGVADLINMIEAAEKAEPEKITRLEQYRGTGSEGSGG